ncbi:ABC transporter permease [Bosea thiooxidans]|nr:ABC transporter permease subunit [Bosea sp. (in: a-proteobacteria)]
MSFDIPLMALSFPRLLEGLRMTLSLLAVSLVFGLLIALATSFARNTRWLSWPAEAYVYFFRGTPLLVQLFMIYFGLPQSEFIRTSPLWPLLREPFWCMCLALSLNNGAYVAEIIRGGLLGVGKGLKEACWALGLSRFHRLRFVTAPIVLRLCLPAYGNEIVSLLKSTALASTVTLLDVTGIARTIVAETFSPYEIFISAALIYLVLTFLVQTIVAHFEIRLNRHAQR